MPDTSVQIDHHPPVEQRVLELIAGAPVRTSELMKKAPSIGVSEADLRETVWSLLDDGLLQLTSDRHLTLP